MEQISANYSTRKVKAEEPKGPQGPGFFGSLLSKLFDVTPEAPAERPTANSSSLNEIPVKLF
eukprot:8112812-Pyramimonas_sp.AAC.1